MIFFTDGNSLKVDRWSAMHVAIKAFLNGEYPYTAVDHMNGRTSNFPGLLLMGVPFYLLGNVGYLEVFAFLLLSYTLYKYLEIHQAIKYILILVISPAFWWEIFAISDLMSNIIIVFCFILWLKLKLKDDLFRYPILLGVSTAFLFMTRGILAISLTLFLFRSFLKIKFSDKLKYIFSFGFTAILLVLLVIINCPSIEILLNYNPLILQTRTIPVYINILAVSLPFYFSFKIENFNKDFFYLTTFLMLFPVIVSFILYWNKFNFEEITLNSLFDLSYFSMVFPFLVFYLVVTNGNLNPKIE